MSRSEAPLRVFLIAGEASGDRLGAGLMRGLRAESGRRLEFLGVGGAAMAAEGLESLFPMQDIAVMGLTEVLPKLRSILSRIRLTADALTAARPDVVVSIDAPDFGLRVVDRAKAISRAASRAAYRAAALGAAAPLFVHYVAPSVWAWRPGRAAKLAKRVDHLLALLPFEPPYFHRVGLSCDFVGHPAAEASVRVERGDPALRAEFGLPPDAPVVVCLPGSRRGEVERLTPVFGQALARLRERHPRLEVLVPAAEGVAELVAARIGAWPVPTRLVDPRGMDFQAAEARKRRAMAAADAALAASGTVSLELAAQRTPMVIGYKLNPLTALIARRLIRVESATLLNLLAGEKVVPEYLQEYCTIEALTGSLDALLTPDDPGRARQLAAADSAMRRLGEGDAPPSMRAARSVLAALQPRVSMAT